MKLGYTEEQLQAALEKLGPQHTQNDLLAELIKLGALARAESEYEAATGRDLPLSDDHCALEAKVRKTASLTDG